MGVSILFWRLPSVDHVGVWRFWNRYRGLEKDVKKILLKKGILGVDELAVVFSVLKGLAWYFNHTGPKIPNDFA
jgi:hypothetical protein